MTDEGRLDGEDEGLMDLLMLWRARRRSPSFDPESLDPEGDDALVSRVLESWYGSDAVKLLLASYEVRQRLRDLEHEEDEDFIAEHRSPEGGEVLFDDGPWPEGEYREFLAESSQRAPPHRTIEGAGRNRRRRKRRSRKRRGGRRGR